MTWNYDQLAGHALAQYELGNADVRFIRHNENMAFQVVAGAHSYLLRIHEPKSTGFIGDWQQPARIEAELKWLQVLNQDKAIITQEPVPTSDGLLVGTVDIAGKESPCSLLTWIEGDTFDPKSEDARTRAGQIGKLIARLHGHAEPPIKLDRPSYDVERFNATVKKLRASVDLGFLSADDFALMERTCQSIFELLDREQKHGRWGLIHSDLGPRNVIVHSCGVSPIDFSLSGYGPLLWDVGGLLPAYPKELRRIMFDSYSEVHLLREEDLRLCDGLAILSILACWAFHLPNPDQHEWLQRRMPKSVENEWLKFERREPFLFEL